MSDLYPLELTSAIGIEGELKRRGSVVWLSQAVAADLLRRGKAKIADAAIEPGADVVEPVLESEPEPDTNPEPELEAEPEPVLEAEPEPVLETEPEPKPAKSSRAKQERAQ